MKNWQMTGKIKRILTALTFLGFLAGAQIITAQELSSDERWLDTGGRMINAHGGGVLFYQGVYYWYGESKTGVTYLPECNKSWGGTRVDLTGVSCYSSTNLHIWKNEGLVLPATSGDANSDLRPGNVLERPKVIFNQATRKFVMWMHIDTADYAAARSGVAVCDTPAGRFKYLGSFRPNAGVWPLNVTDAEKNAGQNNPLQRDFKLGQMARDQTLFVDDDGRAYLFYSSEENSTMHVSLLTEDYLHTAGTYARIFVGRSMEAPAVFKHRGKYYFIGSGCTAWAPNAARSAVADNPLGPWAELGNPCTGPDAADTFHAQSSFVLPVAGDPDKFVAIFDRWKQWDLPASSYLWLPVSFTNDGRLGIRFNN